VDDDIARRNLTLVINQYIQCFWVTRFYIIFSLVYLHNIHFCGTLILFARFAPRTAYLLSQTIFEQCKWAMAKNSFRIIGLIRYYAFIRCSAGTRNVGDFFSVMRTEFVAKKFILRVWTYFRDNYEYLYLAYVFHISEYIPLFSIKYLYLLTFRVIWGFFCRQKILVYEKKNNYSKYPKLVRV